MPCKENDYVDMLKTIGTGCQNLYNIHILYTLAENITTVSLEFFNKTITGL